MGATNTHLAENDEAIHTPGNMDHVNMGTTNIPLVKNDEAMPVHNVDHINMNATNIHTIRTNEAIPIHNVDHDTAVKVWNMVDVFYHQPIVNFGCVYSDRCETRCITGPKPKEHSEIPTRYHRLVWTLSFLRKTSTWATSSAKSHSCLSKVFMSANLTRSVSVYVLQFNLWHPRSLLNCGCNRRLRRPLTLNTKSTISVWE